MHLAANSGRQYFFPPKEAEAANQEVLIPLLLLLLYEKRALDNGHQAVRPRPYALLPLGGVSGHTGVSAPNRMRARKVQRNLDKLLHAQVQFIYPFLLLNIMAVDLVLAEATRA